MDSSEEFLKQMTKRLAEHYDSVQVFVTQYNDDGELATDQLAMGTGNYAARYGQVRLWLLREEEKHRLRVSKDEEHG